MKSAFLALSFIFSINFTENSASDVRMTSFHITSRAYESNVSDVPGSFGVRSIVDCARRCDINDEEYFYHDEGRQKCYCNNETDHEYFMTGNVGNKTKVSYGYRIAENKEKGTEVCKTSLSGLELRDCRAVQGAGCNVSGVYNVTHRDEYPSGFEVFCDMDTDTGGWLVFQRREDGRVNFSRNFEEYKQGFGDVNGEYWIGLTLLNRITASHRRGCELWIDLEDWNGTKAYAYYTEFMVKDVETEYSLYVDGYYGNAGNGLFLQNGASFFTIDNPLKPNNATKGGWWQVDNYDTNLNGKYINDGETDQCGKGTVWAGERGQCYSLKKTEMKLKCPETNSKGGPPVIEGY